MDETTTTLEQITETQKAVNAKLGPEGKAGFAMGHVMGKLALKEEIQNLEAEKESWHYEATHDSKTGALNYKGLDEYIKSVAASPKAVLHIDGTNFKAINDTYDHQTGDRLIKSTYELLSGSLRSGDVIARVGGDEFFVILNGDDKKSLSPDHPLAHEYKIRQRSGTEHIDDAKARIAEKVQDFLDNHGVVDSKGQRVDLRAINFNLAVGGAVCPDLVNAENIFELMNEAELDSKLDKKEQHRSGKYRSA